MTPRALSILASLGALSVSVDPSDIPGWAVGLIFSGFAFVILALVRREFSRLDDLPKALAKLDARMTRIEARDNLGREIADALRRDRAA